MHKKKDDKSQKGKKTETSEDILNYEKILKIYFKDCQNNLPVYFHKLLNEYITYGYDLYQNLLIIESLKNIGNKEILNNYGNDVSFIQFKYRNDKLLKPILDKLKEIEDDQTEKLLSGFEDNKKDFKLLRFRTLKCLLSDYQPEKNEYTAKTASTTDYANIESNNRINELNIDFIKYLKKLLEAAYEYCIVLIKEFDDNIKSNPNDKRNYITSFTKHWNNYVLLAAELDNYLSPIVTSINKVTAKFILDNKVPKFSIFKLLISIFINYYYSGFISNIIKYFKLNVRDLIDDLFNYYAFFCIKKEPENEDKLKNEKKKKFLKELDLKIFDSIEDHMVDIGKALYSLIDMYINEISANYLHSKTFVDNFCNYDDLNEIKEFLLGCFKKRSKAMESIKEFIDDEETLARIGINIQTQVLNSCLEIFPPYFLESLEKITENAKLTEMKKKIYEKIIEFNNINKHDKPKVMWEITKKKNKLEKSEDVDLISYRKSYDTINETVKKYLENKNVEVKNDILEKISDYIKYEDSYILDNIEYIHRYNGAQKYKDASLVNYNEKLFGKFDELINSRFSINEMPLSELEKIKIIDEQDKK